jgi:hypothetical protein
MTVVICVAATLAICCSAACGASIPVPSKGITQARQVGAWNGTGNKTIGFVSESGVFRINWKTRDSGGGSGGTFRLTVRSAISGRPIRVVTDEHGGGSGTFDFVDDPRMYEFIVDSAGVEWSFNAEELR